MKKSLFVTVIIGIIFLAGCAARQDLGQKIDMTLTINPSTVVLNKANFLKQKAKINYSITNRTETNLTKDRYEMVLGLARENELSYTVLQFLGKEIPVGQTVSGTYEHLFEKVLGADGKYEIRFVLSEKDGQYSSQIKMVEAPVEVQYK
ncbi:hypothetical protein HYW83_04010 [Candidatus Peregrinibacteria bacterium]|nr:hypothetical protein [Candidatus Peregrinibacteria bacterium]